MRGGGRSKSEERREEDCDERGEEEGEGPLEEPIEELLRRNEMARGEETLRRGGAEEGNVG